MQEAEVQIKGQVAKGPPNLYWQRNLRQSRLSRLYQSLWKPTKMLAYPLFFVSLGFILLYSFVFFLVLKLKPARTQAVSKETQEALSCYPFFLDIYPTSLYPLVTKAFELALLKGFALREPSLELGTGDGYFTNCLYKFQDEKLTMASDLICDTLLMSSKYDFWRKRAIMDASEVPLPDNSLQTVIMNNLIHHLPDRSEVLKEMRRTLRPGGIFIFTDELISWATSQWYLNFKKGSKCHGKCLDKFLQLTVQSLISSKQYWIEQAAEDGWEVLDIKEFFSNRSMYLSSFLETLNLKLGKPTPKPIRDILDKLPRIKKLQYSLTRQIAEYMIKKDEELCHKHGATCLFVVLRKRESLESKDVNEPTLACPACKTAIGFKTDNYSCDTCRKTFPQFEGIPFLLSYCEDLPLRSYIEEMKGKPIPDFYT